MLALLLLLLFLPASAFAWGPVGHKTVALIAQDRLTDSAKKKVIEILGEGVGLDDVSLCADHIRKNSISCAGRYPMEADKKTAPWHYIDIPVREAATADGLQKHCDKDGADDACVLDQINEQAALLKDTQAPREARQRAIIFLVHFVGDVHMPLHCATEVTLSGRSDHGGNLKWLTRENAKPGDKKITLHGLWDSILRMTWEERGPGPRALADKLGKVEEAESKPWVSGDFVTASVLESHKVARDHIYPEYHKNYGKPVGRAYQDKFRPIAYQRLQQAGIRLAFLINASLH